MQEETWLAYRSLDHLHSLTAESREDVRNIHSLLPRGLAQCSVQQDEGSCATHSGTVCVCALNNTR